LVPQTLNVLKQWTTHWNIFQVWLMPVQEALHAVSPTDTEIMKQWATHWKQCPSAAHVRTRNVTSLSILQTLNTMKQWATHWNSIETRSLRISDIHSLAFAFIHSR
jgi:hypothetical protein